MHKKRPRSYLNITNCNLNMKKMDHKRVSMDYKASYVTGTNKANDKEYYDQKHISVTAIAASMALSDSNCSYDVLQ